MVRNGTAHRLHREALTALLDAHTAHCLSCGEPWHFTSRAQIASAIGVDPATFTHAEAGRRGLRLGVGDQLARVLHVPTSALYCDCAEPAA